MTKNDSNSQTVVVVQVRLIPELEVATRGPQEIFELFFKCALAKGVLPGAANVRFCINMSQSLHRLGAYQLTSIVEIAFVTGDWRLTLNVQSLQNESRGFVL